MSEPVEITVGPPYVEITPRRWGWYEVVLHDGLEWDSDSPRGWYLFGRRWADSKARRALAAHHRREAAANDRWVIE